MRAITITEHGSPEVMRYEELPTPMPGNGQALVHLEAAGVNFIDVNQRIGLFQVAFPYVIGQEGAGVVEAVGPEVTEVRPGDRVAYANSHGGSYADYIAVAAWRLVPIPAGVAAQQAAAVMLQGMTAHYLAHTTYPLKEGDTALIHAAAGATGQLLVQVAKRRGTRVIGTVSTDEKAALARSLGADEVIIYTREDFEPAVKRLTAGRGVDVVYDSVGKETYERSLKCLVTRGMLVLFGQASGKNPPVDPYALMGSGKGPWGSLFLTRPTLEHYMRTRDELMQRAGDVLSWVQSGSLKVRVHQTFPLAKAAEAHRLMQSRGTMGKLLLIP